MPKNNDKHEDRLLFMFASVTKQRRILISNLSSSNLKTEIMIKCSLNAVMLVVEVSSFCLQDHLWIATDHPHFPERVFGRYHRSATGWVGTEDSTTVNHKV